MPHPVSKSEDFFHSVKLLLEEEIQSCHPRPLNLRLVGKYCSSILTVSVSDATVCMLYGRYLFFKGLRVTSLTSKQFKNHSQSLVSFLKLVINNLLILLLFLHRGAKDGVVPQAVAFLVQMRVLSLRPA